MARRRLTPCRSCRSREHRFDVAAVVFDKDGTLLDLDASWGPIAEAWVTGIAGDDATVSALLCDALGLDLAAPVASGPTAASRCHRWSRSRPTPACCSMPRRGPLDRIEAAVERAVVAVDGLTHDKHMDTLVDVPELMAHLRAGGLQIAVFTSDEPEPTTMFLDRFDLHDAGRHRHHRRRRATAEAVARGPVRDRRSARCRHVTAADGRRLHRRPRRRARNAGAPFVSVGHTTRAADGADASVDHVAELRVS